MKEFIKKIIPVIVVLVFSGFFQTKEFKYKTGDIIFLNSKTVQDKTLASLTKSKFSHIGIVVNEEGKNYVYFTLSKVVRKTIPEFVALGAGAKVEVLRFKDTLVLSNTKNLFKDEAKKLLNNPYDNKYSWMDLQIYNTELVWKVFKRATSQELCKTYNLDELKQRDTSVSRKIKPLFGDSISQYFKIVSAMDIYNSQLLVKVR